MAEAIAARETLPKSRLRIYHLEFRFAQCRNRATPACLFRGARYENAATVAARLPFGHPTPMKHQ
jgi:hypothetical protein